MTCEVKTEISHKTNSDCTSSMCSTNFDIIPVAVLSGGTAKELFDMIVHTKSLPPFNKVIYSSSPSLFQGIVGSAVSGKSFLLQCYLSGSQTRMESSYTGRYKKEVKFRGSSYLLLVRDETGPPDLQVRLLYNS